MPAIRRALASVLVAGAVIGCSATGTPSGSPAGSARWASRSTAPGPVELRTPLALPSQTTLPTHETLAGPDVAGAFDLATDGRLIAWSSGKIDVDAPSLWTFDPSTRETRLVYRSPTRGAILANLALRDRTFAFAEVTPRPDGSRTWRLVLVDPVGRVHVLDTNDVPSAQSGVLPMAALAEPGVVWATTHAGTAGSLRCELRYATLETLRTRVVRSEPCSRVELWYPRSDGSQVVYGTVEYGASGPGDSRHVYLATEGSLDEPLRLDTDGEASLPAIAAGTVVWKSAPRDLNMFNPGSIVELSLGQGSVPRIIPFGSAGSVHLTTPSVGPGYVAADDAGGSLVLAWDRARQAILRLDELRPSDPGFVSGARLVGSLFAWFYTSSTGGRGVREIRWLKLPSP